MIDRLGIVGLGLLGGSIALRARELGVKVVGLDRDGTVMDTVRRCGMVDAGVDSLEELCGQVDALVLATPVDAIMLQIAEMLTFDSAYVARLRWIIDVASVKAPIVARASALSNFVGTHPMAGAETCGPAAAEARLFLNRPWAYMSGSTGELRREVVAFITAMGATPIELDADEHDTIVAASSHVPQSLATILAAGLRPAALRGVYGTGLASMTRLAASPWSIWQGIYAANAVAVLNELQSFRSQLELFMQALEKGDMGMLAAYFAQAQAHQRELTEYGALKGVQKTEAKGAARDDF